MVDGANVDHITTRALGSRRFEMTFTGPGGHSWSDFGVGNPLHALCRAVALFAETRLNGAPKSAFNVGLIEGGSSVNAIAQSARAKVDIRSESNEKMDELVEILCGRRRSRARSGKSAGGRREGHGEAEGDRLAARGGAAGERRHSAIRPRGGCAPGHPLPPGLLLHRRQYSAFAGHAGNRDRRRAARAAARIPRRNGFCRRAAIWGSNGSCSRCCCCCARRNRAVTRPPGGGGGARLATPSSGARRLCW